MFVVAHVLLCFELILERKEYGSKYYHLRFENVRNAANRFIRSNDHLSIMRLGHRPVKKNSTTIRGSRFKNDGSDGTGQSFFVISKKKK